MSLKVEYRDYLRHFGSTVCLHEFARGGNDLIALRHDIDHCIDTALEMAFWEADAGIRSSYFILNTAPYRDDPRLFDKCRQIQAFGHEVGIHTNSITLWYTSGEDPYLGIERELAGYRQAGIDVRGTSAHGDAACYRHGFINYWLFRELRTDAVEQRESQLNAEGIFEPDEARRIAYPEDHRLRREDGATLELWAISQQSLGLEYEASHLQADAYYSDSGGSWKRSPNPLRENLRGKRVQVLIHPVHWKAPRKIFFFLSTARSGSKWLSEVLQQASSCDAKHEYTLNHFSAGDDEVSAEKMTGNRLHELLADAARVEDGLEHTRKLVDRQFHDYAEANVYLPMVLAALEEKFPDAKLIHLKRNPADVVRSLMNRGWYDTPHDSAHPAELTPEWGGLSPFEKCCSYIKTTNQQLQRACSHRLEFEAMVADRGYLENQLKQLGIAFYPMLAEPLMGCKVNAGRLEGFPSYAQWPKAQRDAFDRFINDRSEQLEFAGADRGLLQRLWQWLRHGTPMHDTEAWQQSTTIYQPKSVQQLVRNCYTKNLRLQQETGGVLITPKKSAEHAYFMFSGGKWSKLNRGAGWRIRANGYYTISMHNELSRDSKVTVFCLYYDSRRKQVYRRALGVIRDGASDVSLSFAMMGNSRLFNIGLYLAAQKQPPHLFIGDVKLRFCSY